MIKKEHMKGFPFLLLLICLIQLRVAAQEKDSITVAMQPIVVTASRIPTNSLYVSRTIDIIDEEMIKTLGATSVEELLQRESNVDIQPRGIFGVQSDVSIRGALFGQQLILLNSVRMNDAQTAHHNFDLPISLDQIERIEVLKGAGSALYGPDAYGGVINIITRIPDQQSFSLKLSGGEYGFVDGSGNYDFSSPSIHSSNTIEHRRSDGYQFDTDFKITSISSNNTVELPFGTYSVFGGYTNKAFGAFHFYGPSPSKEWTETTFLSATTKITLPSSIIQPKFSYRRHYDKFMYDLRTPDQFVNINTTNSYNGELQSIIQAYESVSLIVGVEGNSEDITSTNLKNHQRSSLGFLATVHSILQNTILIDFGMREDIHSEYGDQFNPTFDVGYLFSTLSKIFLTAGRSFRAPSYTELYYTSPSRIGNPNLKPETGWSYEAGTDFYLHPQIKFSTSVFERDQANLIDYVEFSSSDIAFHATNFTSAVTRGVEASLQWRDGLSADRESANDFTLQSLLVSYTYLDSRIDRGNVYSSLYSFTHPRHQFNAVVTGTLLLSIHGTISATHKIKLDGTHYTLVEAKINKSFSRINVFIQGTNLLNQSYVEIVGVPLPGRWLWAGVELKVL
jgi:iron complex outermembrane receptor protein